MPCFDLCSAAFFLSFPIGYGFVPALSHLGKCRFGTIRYASFHCALRVCRPILWSDLLCLYQLGAIHALCDLIFFILWRITVPPLFVLSVVIEGPGGSLVMFCLCDMGFGIPRPFASYSVIRTLTSPGMALSCIPRVIVCQVSATQCLTPYYYD